jgi:hypothetical protein
MCSGLNRRVKKSRTFLDFKKFLKNFKRIFLRIFLEFFKEFFSVL